MEIEHFLEKIVNVSERELFLIIPSKEITQVTCANFTSITFYLFLRKSNRTKEEGDKNFFVFFFVCYEEKSGVCIIKYDIRTGTRKI